MHRWDLAGVLRRDDAQGALLAGGEPEILQDDALEWSWPPYAPVETDDAAFDTADWAPSSVVWHPQVRLGRWTVLYRRCA